MNSRYLPFVAVLLALFVGQSLSLADQKGLTRLPVPDDAIDGETSFYGAYMSGSKIGWYSETGELRKRRGKEVICIRTATHTDARSFGKEIKSVETEESWFAKEAPHPFIGGRVVARAGDVLRHIEIEKVGDGFRATIKEAGKVKTRDFELEDYVLADLTSPTVWIREGVKVGDSIKVRSVSLSDLESTLDTITITKTPNPEKKTVFYSATLENSKDGMVGVLSINGEGTVEEFNVGGTFLIKLEDEEDAKRIEELDLDLFSDNIVKIDDKLGRTDQIESLVLKISGPSAKKVPSGPNQKAEFDEETQTLTLSIGRAHGVESKATEKEIEDGLEDTISYPAKDPDVVKLAKSAVKKAGNDKEKQVAMLVEFVDEFIRDDMTADPMSVTDIMEKRSGDCTEHALLFVTLARSLGIPAREISGIYYADELEGFGGHAWAEVVIDGKWHPVDPAWSQPWTDAAHIRMYTHGVSDYSQQVAQLAGNLSIKVESIKRKK